MASRSRRSSLAFHATLIGAPITPGKVGQLDSRRLRSQHRPEPRHPNITLTSRSQYSRRQPRCPSDHSPCPARQAAREYATPQTCEPTSPKAEYCDSRIPTLHQWSRHTTEAVIGAVTGAPAAPTTALLGRFDADGRLQYAGRTTVLNLAVRQTLAAELQPGGPAHPWTGWTFSASWGSREQLAVRLVEPVVVAEGRGRRVPGRGWPLAPPRAAGACQERSDSRRCAAVRAGTLTSDSSLPDAPTPQRATGTSCAGRGQGPPSVDDGGTALSLAGT